MRALEEPGDIETTDQTIMLDQLREWNRPRYATAGSINHAYFAEHYLLPPGINPYFVADMADQPTVWLLAGSELSEAAAMEGELRLEHRAAVAWWNCQPIARRADYLAQRLGLHPSEAAELQFGAIAAGYEEELNQAARQAHFDGRRFRPEHLNYELGRRLIDVFRVRHGLRHPQNLRLGITTYEVQVKLGRRARTYGLVEHYEGAERIGHVIFPPNDEAPVIHRIPAGQLTSATLISAIGFLPQRLLRKPSEPWRV